MKRSIVIQLESNIAKIPKETIEKIYNDINKNDKNIFLSYTVDFK